MIWMPGSRYQGALPPATDELRALEQELHAHVDMLGAQIGERIFFTTTNSCSQRNTFVLNSKRPDLMSDGKNSTFMEKSVKTSNRKYPGRIDVKTSWLLAHTMIPSKVVPARMITEPESPRCWPWPGSSPNPRFPAPSDLWPSLTKNPPSFKPNTWEAGCMPSAVASRMNALSSCSASKPLAITPRPQTANGTRPRSVSYTLQREISSGL